MHPIVETSLQLKQLQNHCTDSCFIQIIPGNDMFHPKLTNISCVYYRCLNSKGYIFPINHSETFNLEWSDVLDFIKKHDVIHVIDKKFHDYFLPETIKTTDIQFKVLNKTNKIINLSDYDTPVHTHFSREHYFRHNLNNLIPISKHLEKWEKVFEQVRDFIDGKVDEYFDIHFTRVFKTIEQTGIKISPNKFNMHFEPTFEEYSINKNKIYTHYNLYNLTTRPSNAFNNINFAALPKESGARNSFIPNYDYFIEYDFTAYHPSIIGSLFNFKFNGSPYLYLSKILNVSEEEAKEITFKNIYGGVKEQFRDKEYFRQVYGLSKQLFKDYTENNFKIAGNRQIYEVEDATPSKLLNYTIQSFETKSNVELISKVIKYLETKQSKICLYTYDSILIDFSKEDGIETVMEIKQLLESTGFTTKMKKGTTYGF